RVGSFQLLLVGGGEGPGKAVPQRPGAIDSAGRQEFFCREYRQRLAAGSGRRPDLPVGVGAAVALPDPPLRNAKRAADAALPVPAHAVALGSDLQADLSDAAPGIKPLVLVTHGRNACAGEEGNGHGLSNLVALDEFDAPVFTPVMTVSDKGLK